MIKFKLMKKKNNEILFANISQKGIKYNSNKDLAS